jgi:hypothetical protein
MSFDPLRTVAMGILAILMVEGAHADSSAFPPGYEAAYRAYRASLTPAQRRIAWLDFDGVISPPQPIQIGGRPALWTSSCKPHDCGDNIVIVFLPDRQHAMSVVYMNGTGRPYLAGGAGPRELACVKALLESGWSTKLC